MDNKFIEIMAKRSDAELIQIITISREDYLPEALLAAEKELDKRKLTAPQFESVIQKIINEQQFYEDYTNAHTGSGWGVIETLGEFFFFDIF